jgi:hypothetical protein
MKKRKVKQALSGAWYSGREKDIRNLCKRVNMVEILLTHV